MGLGTRCLLMLVSALFWPLLHAASASAAPPMDKHYYLPDAAASKIVSVAREGNAAAEVVVFTVAVAINETGPKETVAKFGEVYAFSPTFIAVQREVPTTLTSEIWSPTTSTISCWRRLTREC